MLPPAIGSTALVRVAGEPSALFSMPRYDVMPLNARLTMTPPMGWNGYNHYQRNRHSSDGRV